MWWREFYPKKKPKQARGGIKAQTKRGAAFGSTWWAKRWIEVLESFDIGARLTRGRSYARKGQVLSIDVAEGKVRSQVQGSMPDPYEITIAVALLSEKKREAVTAALAGQPLFAAKLLSGEMPQDIETVFQSAGTSLFPAALEDLETECSCPDWSNPCKHIAAVYYLLGEEFDRDPFLLFKLRGLDRDALMKRLGTVRPAEAAEPAESVPAAPPEPLPEDPAQFWTGAALPADLAGGAVETPRVSAAWPKRLGNFPFWRGQEHFHSALERTYREAAEAGLEMYLGEQQGAEKQAPEETNKG
jgi:uncharacterized Zn finger protein